MSTTEAAPAVAPAATKQQGMRVNGKHWLPPKAAFRPTGGLTSFEKRRQEREAMKATKAKEKEMKDEKEALRKQKVQAIKDKRAAKEEKERG
ncbi:rRNA-processing protein CGR1 like [Verticillium longisporum]|nr:rRNA-processing protein CGR1 like [Verticillium longisporum]